MNYMRITFEPFAEDGDSPATIGPLMVECRERPGDQICFTSWSRELRPGDSITLKLKIAAIEAVNSDDSNDP